MLYNDNTLFDVPKLIIEKMEIEPVKAMTVEECLDLQVRCQIGRNQCQLIRNNAVGHNATALYPTKHQVQQGISNYS